jgi:hypothetical protein
MREERPRACRMPKMFAQSGADKSMIKFDDYPAREVLPSV